uniref:hypothetical protein n=1 Tax=Agrobacterium tumefaciens complex TaxID=1183400 RepID=UPI000B33C6AB|nr:MULTISPECIES: hypothetical protein [Agrobacterium tumefaciens complex]
MIVFADDRTDRKVLPSLVGAPITDLISISAARSIAVAMPSRDKAFSASDAA